jgi:hypothetical protein
MTSAQQRANSVSARPVNADNNGYPPDTFDQQWALAFRSLTLLHDGNTPGDAQLARTSDGELALARLVLTSLQHDDGSSVA